MPTQSVATPSEKKTSKPTNSTAQPTHTSPPTDHLCRRGQCRCQGDKAASPPPIPDASESYTPLRGAFGSGYVEEDCLLDKKSCLSGRMDAQSSFRRSCRLKYTRQISIDLQMLRRMESRLHFASQIAFHYHSPCIPFHPVLDQSLSNTSIR